MSRFALAGAALYTPEAFYPDGCVIIEGKTITYAGPRGTIPVAGIQVMELPPGLIISPGLLDLHVHGCGGYAVCSDRKQLAELSLALAAQGITGFLATTMSAPLRALGEILAAAGAAREAGLPGAELLGVHLEGPFINPDYAGAQDQASITGPSLQALQHLIQAGGSKQPPAMITLAPEIPGAQELIACAASQGIVVAAGHSGASYEEMLAAVTTGLSYATHLFNRMVPLHHRAPGLIGAALTHPGVTVEVIADGVHLHPALLQIIYGLAGERLVLASDNLPCTGLPSGSYEYCNRQKTIGDAVWDNSGNLAGTNRSLPSMVMTMQQAAELTLGDALALATTHPARVLGQNHRVGRLAPSYDADLAVFTAELQPRLTIKKGVAIYQSPLLSLQGLPT